MIYEAMRLMPILYLLHIKLVCASNVLIAFSVNIPSILRRDTLLRRNGADSVPASAYVHCVYIVAAY